MPNDKSSSEATDPLTSKLPHVGAYTPASALSNVDLPAPLLPIKPTLSPCSMENEMPSIARMLMPRESFAMRPPVAALISVFFNERLEESNIG